LETLKVSQRFGYPAEDAHQDIIDLIHLPLRAVSTGELAPEALKAAMTHGITAYDAAYVALARRLSLLLVTADETLVRHLAGTLVDVRWLGKWPENALHHARIYKL